MKKLFIKTKQIEKEIFEKESNKFFDSRIDIQHIVHIPTTNEKAIRETKTTFFKSVGMALFDLLTAEKVYQKAIEKGKGTQIDF